MQHASVYRLGGTALVLGALLYAVSVFLHPLLDAPDALAMADPSAVATAHWLGAFAGLLTLGGILALARGFAGERGDGWAMLGAAAAILGIAVITSVAVTEVAALDADGTAASALLAASFETAIMGRAVAWLSLAGMGLAMLHSDEWPMWLAYAGIGIGVLEAVLDVVVGDFAVGRIIFLLGFVWLAVTGALMARMGGARPAAAEPTAAQPGAPAGPAM